jgi:hypothetical protein
LVVALQRIREGGSLVVLLHKPEAWDNVELINAFTRFSSVYLFKPERKHTIRSSFYLVATKIRPRDQEALSAVRIWKDRWKTATFETIDTLKTSLSVSKDHVDTLLAHFGPQFIDLATPIWKIQAAGLQSAPFIKKKKGPTAEEMITTKD